MFYAGGIAEKAMGQVLLVRLGVMIFSFACAPFIWKVAACLFAAVSCRSARQHGALRCKHYLGPCL